MSSVLSDERILWHQYHDHNFDIDPFDKTCVQPASYDLHLSNEFEKIEYGDVIDLHGDGVETKSMERETFTLHANECILGSTVESIKMPRGFVGVVDGRSSLGRLFVSVHVTAGYVDPCFEGDITLEIVNHGRNPVTLHAGDRIGQIRWHKVMGEVKQGYDETGHYQNQSGVTPTRFNFK
jgi:dCTP deaminase